MNAAPPPETTQAAETLGAPAARGAWSPWHLCGPVAWIVFGPITGVLSHQAGRAMGQGRRWAAAGYVALNVAILVSLPLATVALGHWLPHRR
jgi:hypothetical protein